MSEKIVKIAIHRKVTPIKKRSQSAYNNKVRKIEKWYNQLLKVREKEPAINKNTKLPNKRKELKPLEDYIKLITKVR